MDKKLIVFLGIVLYLAAGFFYCNPWAASAITGNEIPVEIPEILADDNNEQQENSSWNGHYALVRFRGINLSTDIETLIACIELLKSKDIPFSITLTQVYKNPKENITIYLNETPELVRIIKDSGATIVLNGYVYKHDGETAVVPTDLGYVRGGEEIISSFEIIRNAEQIARSNDSDAIVSFFYDPFFGSDYLRTIIGGLKKQGYRFASPEEYIMSVNPEDIETIQQYPYP
jgi:hypothetical protein